MINRMIDRRGNQRQVWSGCIIAPPGVNSCILAESLQHPERYVLI
ncbi:MAG TPA: hypothetical protein VK619_19860 [Pyrinomonadaceae bacterium]|nr:hypothetical protein [Pyrinomonadaceae bacterium]